MHLTNTLITLRKKHGFSQEQLAERLGVSRQTVSRWEVGEYSPSMKHLKVLSDLYQVPVTVFFQETPSASEPAPMFPEVSVYLTVRQFLAKQRWTLGLLFCLLGLTVELFSIDQHRLLDDALFLAGLGILLFRVHVSPSKAPSKRSFLPVVILVSLIGLESVIVWCSFACVVPMPYVFSYARMTHAVLYSLGTSSVLLGIAGVVQEIHRFPGIHWNGQILCALSLTLLVSVVWLFSLCHDTTMSHTLPACWPLDFGKECAYAALGSTVILLIESGIRLANLRKS